MRNKILRYIIACLVILSVTGCEDKYFQDDIIGDGGAMVSVTVDFKPMSAALAQSRSAGKALDGITSLYVLVYDTDMNLIDDYKWKIDKFEVTDEGRTDNNAENGHLAEVSTKRATFKLPKRIEFGKYYMYAVANIPDLFTTYINDIQTIKGLRNIPLEWDSENVANNSQMIGCLLTRVTDLPVDEEQVILNATNTNLHAWLRRAASKVTVAFDGSSLKEGVTITIKSLRIKNIPVRCLLGNDNTVTAESPSPIDGEEIPYESQPQITKDMPFYPAKQETAEDGTVSWVKDPDSHSEDNRYSLFFYENKQGEGEDKRQKDEDGDGGLDKLFGYKDKPYATYIEVDTHFESTNPERPGICNITYRFMLGQNITTDYNATRNCHYKLTLKFNGFADDPDWRIDYVNRLWVTQPKTVDYRGKYFVPDTVSPNQGNTFSDNNIITVTSFMYDRDDWFNRKPMDYKIEYKDSKDNKFTETRPAWLGEFDKTDKGNGVTELKVNYTNSYTIWSINDTLSKYSKTGTYDLSTKGGTESRNTANSYIVDAKGTYQFPLVYGNAITNGSPDSTSYTYSGWLSPADFKILTTFKNYNDKAISSPYIEEDVKASSYSASVLWQDERDLITDPKYVAKAYDSKIGGIQFTVGDGIKEGNAVIALKDNNNKIIWSWHIWVTAIDFSKNITLTNRTNRQFEIMPINLGWCSGGTPLRYYDRHECEVKFTQIISREGEEEEEGMSMTVKIIQEPHIAVPVGNNPYYQWGRKDPFVAGGSKNETTKTWYDAGGNTKTSDPELMYAEDSQRVVTYKATAALIQNPDKWQNGPRIERDTATYKDLAGPFMPKDTIYGNLWDNSWIIDDGAHVTKTIYDPCPPGYHVSPYYAFTGFTTDGGPIGGAIDTHMYAATAENMMPKVSDADNVYRDNVLEFYTDVSKLISIGFPENGYRDWDADAKLLQYGQGEVWHAQSVPHTWAKYSLKFLAYHLEYTRETNYWRHIYPWNNFYNTDGMAIRPTKIL